MSARYNHESMSIFESIGILEEEAKATERKLVTALLTKSSVSRVVEALDEMLSPTEDRSQRLAVILNLVILSREGIMARSETVSEEDVKELIKSMSPGMKSDMMKALNSADDHVADLETCRACDLKEGCEKYKALLRNPSPDSCLIN